MLLGIPKPSSAVLTDPAKAGTKRGSGNSGHTIVRRDLAQSEYVEEARLRAMGIHSRIAAPLNTGGRTIGLISVGRADRDA